MNSYFFKLNRSINYKLYKNNKKIKWNENIIRNSNSKQNLQNNKEQSENHEANNQIKLIIVGINRTTTC